MLHICPPDWGDQMPDFALAVVDSVPGYVLTETSEEGSVSVTVAGVPPVDFDGTSRTAVVNDSEVARGQEVEMTYPPMSDCN